MNEDLFTFEIIEDQLIAAAEESFIRLGRSSQSPIIYEVLDYACAITDRNGDLIAQANGVPGFLGTLSFAVKAVIQKHAGKEMTPGDLFITNDPYSGGGNHLSDVALILPIFFDGVLVAFSVNKAHWTEVGGMAPGSWTTDSREIYQEGLQFPVIRLGRNYKPDPNLIDLISANVRTPERTLHFEPLKTDSWRYWADTVLRRSFTVWNQSSTGVNDRHGKRSWISPRAAFLPRTGWTMTD